MTYNVGESISKRCGKSVTASSLFSGGQAGTKKVMGLLRGAQSDHGQCHRRRILGRIRRKSAQAGEAVVHHAAENGPECCNSCWNGHRWSFELQCCSFIKLRSIHIIARIVQITSWHYMGYRREALKWKKPDTKFIFETRSAWRSLLQERRDLYQAGPTHRTTGTSFFSPQKAWFLSARAVITFSDCLIFRTTWYHVSLYKPCAHRRWIGAQFRHSLKFAMSSWLNLAFTLVRYAPYAHLSM